MHFSIEYNWDLVGVFVMLYNYIYIHITWRFLKMGDPQNHGFQYYHCLILDDFGVPAF